MQPVYSKDQILKASSYFSNGFIISSFLRMVVQGEQALFGRRAISALRSLLASQPVSVILA